MKSIQIIDNSDLSPPAIDFDRTCRAARRFLFQDAILRTATHIPTEGASRPATKNHAIGRLLLASFLFATLGLLSINVDLPVSASFLGGESGPIWHAGRDAIRKLCRPTEAFGHGVGAVLILAVLFAAGSIRLRQAMSMAVIVFGSGMAANVGKMIVGRMRPKVFYDDNVGGFLGAVGDSFSGWFPMAELGHAGQSFPSGHTAVAVALAICLVRRWPQARWAFVVLPIMSAMQRIAFGHHYLSDCLISAAIACAVAGLCHAMGLRIASSDHSPADAAFTSS